MNRDIYPHIQRCRALNSGLHIFPPTDSLPRLDGSSHSFYLNVTEGFPYAGHYSKYKDRKLMRQIGPLVPTGRDGSGKR